MLRRIFALALLVTVAAATGVVKVNATGDDAACRSARPPTGQPVLHRAARADGPGQALPALAATPFLVPPPAPAGVVAALPRVGPSPAPPLTTRTSRGPPASLV